MPIESTYALDDALDLIGSKWTLYILRNLCSEAKGFNELARALPGISPGVLSQRLKQLAEKGLVEKQVFPTNPPTVQYRVSGKGASLKGILQALADWAEAL